MLFNSIASSKWRFKSWFLLLFVVVACFASVKVYGLITKHIRHANSFSIDKIRTRDDQGKSLKVTQEQIANANEILNQPFFFLGKGRQCYAFESCDGQYVLKFFQQERFQIKGYLGYLPDFAIVEYFRTKKMKQKEQRLKKMLKSFELAVERIPDETGVFFAHLSPTQNLHHSVSILDSRGTMLLIPLDEVQFVLQKKAILLKPTLVKLMHQDKVEGAKERIAQIFDLLVDCARKGIQDTDGALIRNDNLGFLDDRAIYIDTGKLVQLEKPVTATEFIHDLRRVRPLHNWLKKNYPVLAEHFQECQEKAIEQLPV
ncbi:MAG: hypothetical protein JWO53_778 [Chlamydiia bacterium]|nr:hypothetical protein [Chlamydiia bacterium]